MSLFGLLLQRSTEKCCILPPFHRSPLIADILKYYPSARTHKPTDYKAFPFKTSYLSLTGTESKGIILIATWKNELQMPLVNQKDYF